ncbi:MAG: hypothetical protein QOD75_424 [Blastocatellia bacterium]|nr:hypothetical protein [Blastocatellia bacterium]
MSTQVSFRRFLYATTAAGLAVVLISIHRLTPADLDWRFLLLALVTLVIGSQVSVPIPHVKAEITVGDTLIFFAMLLYGGEAAVLLAAAEGFVLTAHVTRKPRVFLINSAQMACSTFLTVWALRSLFGSIEDLHRGGHPGRYVMAACVMASVQCIANSGLAAVYTALKTDEPIWNTWRKYYLWTSITYFAGASVACITAQVVGGISVYAAIIISPIVAIIYFSYRTYLKHAEAAGELRNSEARYRDLFENAKDATYVHDLEGRFASVNRAAEKLTGYSRAELLGKAFRHFVPFEQVQRIRDYSCRQLRDKGETAYESEVMTKDGRRVAVEFNSHLIFENDVPVGVQGTARDITERKRAEEQLKQSERQLAEAQHVARVGSWNWDFKGETVNWSDELYRIFGVGAQSFNPIYQELVDEFIHVDDRALIKDIVARSLKSQQPFSCYYRIHRPDGEERVIHCRGNVVIDEEGNPIRMFGTGQDVTELRRVEEELRTTTEQLRALSARLQSAREEEGRRIARELHDELGAALTALRWGLDEIGNIVLTTAPNRDDQTLRRKTSSMATLVDDTLNTVRRISSELRPSLLDDLGLLVALEWQAGQFQARSGIRCQYDCALANVELTDDQSTAIFRAFQEALTNILRHAHASRVNIKIECEGGDFVLTVSDNGRGISAREISEQQSLGILGMRERALLVGGDIDIRGATGKGTVVKVRVPIPIDANLTRRDGRVADVH